jgi:flavin-dependent dehydrogenase
MHSFINSLFLSSLFLNLSTIQFNFVFTRSEGIHLAMHSGKLAADVLAECFKHQNFSEGYMKKYQDKWMKEMGHEFYW